MNEHTIGYFLMLLPVVAFLYSSVGHGGASAYLALMTLFGFTPEYMKPMALLLNTLVSLVSFLQYYRTTPVKWNLFISLASASIPMALIGGTITIQAPDYRIILGIILLIPALRLFLDNHKQESATLSHNTFLSLMIGGSIGFLSGLIGIGGGILLSPLLIHLRWTSIKETAVISALFIFLNSLAGLLGNGLMLTFQDMLPLNYRSLAILALALVGGVAGAYAGARSVNTTLLKKILGLVLIIASVKLIFM